MDSQKRAYDKWREKNGDYWRRRRYGLKKGQYAQMVEVQGNACAVCLRVTDHLWVDHDHSTGVVRELLCPSCNRMLGAVHEDIAWLKRMIEYLEKHRG